MRPWPLLVLACVLGCKPAPDGPNAPVSTPQAANGDAAKAPSGDAPPSAPGSDEHDANDPDAEQRFCEKLTKLMVASRGANPGSAGEQELVETCVTNARRKRAEDPPTFEREVECISNAPDLSAFFDCALDPPAPRATGDRRFLPLCNKLAELARNEPDFPEEVKLELQDTARCAADAQMEHDAAPQEFEQIQECILAATGMRDAAECTAAGANRR